ncbi:hypothetical protein [Rubellimicrobium sp. CFH 75288]|uniref:hypothetical protein n=1 Tax=Rubellimicrobium sp. CFH 75288 TaxID=2697034 RepID=UPI001412676E|nr:hypothetical protein [Rubellimicrobium sp. CFH 75288]NAZ36251.1 hypothetical protein [Rubellimicrobium sp. CFH 75288]
MRPSAPALPPDLARRRDLIAGCGGRFCTVTFLKKDGSLRTMQVQPAALRLREKGERALPHARRAAATRAARHPHLLPVWDVRARAPRSVDLRTVRRIAADGRVHRFGLPDPL